MRCSRGQAQSALPATRGTNEQGSHVPHFSDGFLGPNDPGQISFLSFHCSSVAIQIRSPNDRVLTLLSKETVNDTQKHRCNRTGHLSIDEHCRWSKERAETWSQNGQRGHRKAPAQLACRHANGARSECGALPTVARTRFFRISSRVGSPDIHGCNCRPNRACSWTGQGFHRRRFPCVLEAASGQQGRKGWS